MRRIASICLVSLLAVLLLAPMFNASAQSIKVFNIGRSLNSMTAPVKGATAPAWNIATGLRAVGTKSRAYIGVDTIGSGAVGTPTWTLVSKPAGSTATLDSANGKWINSVKVDTVGEYVISATVGTKTANDTIFASTYVGVSATADAGCTCHSFMTTGFAALVSGWSNSKHAKIFKSGITGNEEIGNGRGTYGTSCIKCHTTGWDNTAANNNFGIQVKQTGWDTTWYKGLEGSYYINTGDTTKYKMLNANQVPLATIGCEQCHGPAAAHKPAPSKANIGKSLSADVCNQCHDGSRRHSLGTFFALSAHAARPTEAAVGCQPCHTGKGFLYYMDHNKDTSGIAAVWNANTDGLTPITCQVCHDPHGSSFDKMVRTNSIKGDTLRNGYKLPLALRSSPGLLCVNCHYSRYSVKTRVTTTAPYYGFVNRYGPHENPQGDMFYGTNGYQYGDTTFTGIGTHQGLEGGCTTCHMQMRMNRLDGSANLLPNHSFSMSDTTFATGVYKPTDVCKPCHGEIEDFNDVRALYDYDRNGKIEGVQTEVLGMLNALKAKLPIDSTTGEPTLATKDSLKLKNHPEFVQGIWNYSFVKNDKSLGVHNTKYAVRLLYKSLGWTPLSVEQIPGELPKEFTLEQNYPNPFNPSTTIRFSMPKEAPVTLEVYDLTGALVKTIINEALSAGNKEVRWDGSNSKGAKVSSGMYIYRLKAGDFSSVKKMVLMK